ncbi:hypothetical protein [Halostreptopolyspora alba]|uniref:Uncharacterized protein n=1 Tax=Halostreptopolyspora alba TaxID=2487137 RepID=A0A3N0E5Q3_9ACTN|nr:hypothetical protein EFW17_16850 [Nocardiopsaceae bacterium YIM 96095]
MPLSHNARTAATLLTQAAEHEPGSQPHTALTAQANAYAALAQASALEALIDRTQSIGEQLAELRDDLAHK